jgi:SAM-dependent methyltransferase
LPAAPESAPTAGRTGDDGAMSTDVFYGADQALLHHAAFGRLATWAGDHLVDLLHQAGLRGGTVVDLGCGSGILARVVSARGYDVFGVDISPDMIELARKEAPDAEFRCGSVLDAAMPTAVAVTATGEVLNYAADRRTGYTALRDLADRVAAALVPGGLFLFDLSTPGGNGLDPVRRQWHDRDEWTLYLEARENPTEHILDRRITIFRRTGPDTYRRTDERHVLRLFEPDAVVAELAAAGLETEVLAGYPSDTPTEPPIGWSVFLARKPAEGVQSAGSGRTSLAGNGPGRAN